MISFIVIGRNIEFTAERCIRSILKFIEENKISRNQIIYVDSDSSDRTIELIKDFPIEILQIKGDVNAAIGRNEGANKAKGDILFFIDGDMEIISEFYKTAFKDENTLNYPFVTGDFTDQFYNDKFHPISNTNSNKQKKLNKPVFMSIVGGLFIIEKKYWEKMNGMDNRLIRNQDLDFGLRMAQINIPNLRYHNLLAIHHTVSYYNKKRRKQFLFDTRMLSSGILIRKHIFNKNYIKTFIRSRYSLIMLGLSIIGILLQFKLGVIIILFYIALQIVRSYRSYKKEGELIVTISYKILYDIVTIIGFIFYFPKSKKYSTITIKL